MIHPLFSFESWIHIACFLSSLISFIYFLNLSLPAPCRLSLGTPSVLLFSIVREEILGKVVISDILQSYLTGRVSRLGRRHQRSFLNGLSSALFCSLSFSFLVAVGGPWLIILGAYYYLHRHTNYYLVQLLKYSRRPHLIILTRPVLSITPLSSARLPCISSSPCRRQPGPPSKPQGETRGRQLR